MKVEIESMYSNQVWDLVNALEGIKLIGCKWVYKRKRGVNGKVETFKIDVKTALLNSSLDESICMVQPDGFNERGQEHMVYDVLLIGIDVGMLSSIKVWLSSQFSMKDLGEASYVLGIKLLRDRHNRTLALSQALHIDQVWSRFISRSLETLEEEERMRKRCKEINFRIRVYFVRRQSIIEERQTIESTKEAKYVAAAEAAKEAVWLRKFLTDLGVVLAVQKLIVMYCDNSGVVA
ncbi:hypothetical protein CRG98_020627 [Punica granatum]|uniref:Reverse transcriptase Ty1/copia-type domain-containing protein n=1 Tax=Punica granatum TaxID=22663 RepID=A0A2I0JRS1_PUNGR|nr:hypothetical protein CRG98_020627 [Punica granatum]